MSWDRVLSLVVMVTGCTAPEPRAFLRPPDEVLALKPLRHVPAMPGTLGQHKLPFGIRNGHTFGRIGDWFKAFYPTASGGLIRADPSSPEPSAADLAAFARVRPHLAAIGFWSFGDVNGCTVTYLGNALAFTAGHCLVSCDEVGYYDTIQWSDRTKSTVDAIAGCGLEASPPEDWALLHLTGPLPSTHFSTATLPDLATISMLHYSAFPSGDVLLQYSGTCSLLSAPTTTPLGAGLVAHDCDTSSSASGSALLLGSGAVGGLHLGNLSPNANVGERLQALQQNDGGQPPWP